jgi:hypothetical protein
MDTTSTALTGAWLDAVRRAQSEMVQRLAQIAPQSRPSRAERTLSDVIESAVQSGGAAPPRQSAVESASSPQRSVDKRV